MHHRYFKLVHIFYINIGVILFYFMSFGSHKPQSVKSNLRSPSGHDPMSPPHEMHVLS